MAGSTVGGLSRVTVVAPETRVDLALPSDVPLADQLPTLLRYAGADLADDGAAHGGWVLSRLGGQCLDSSRSPAQLDVRDGELLYFTPRNATAPEVVFDDVVDAIATATNDRTGRWRAEHSRRAALGLAVVALLGGAVTVLMAGPPQLPGALVALGLGGLLLGVAAVLSRAVGDSRSGVAFGLVALVFAAVGGLLVGAADRTLDALAAPHLLIAATAVIVAASLGMVGVGDAGPVFLTAMICALTLALAAAFSLVPGIDTAAAAATAATLSFASLPALPMLAYRLARLPVPTIPTDADDLRTDAESVDGRQVLAQSDRADAFLSALLASVAVICAGGSVVLALTGGYPGLALCTVLSLLLLIRARWFLGRRQRMPMLAAAVVGMALVALTVFRTSGPTLRLTAVLGGLLLLALISAGYGLAGVGRKLSPVWGRLIDIVEIVLIVAVIPLAAWVCGAYAAIRAIRG